MTDPIEEPVKRKRGRPKLEEGEKGNYNVSRRVKARRDSQRKVRAAKKRANNHSKKLNAARTSVKKAQQSLRRPLEDYAHLVSCIFTYNDTSKITS